jgi:hypothetical protein
MEQRIEWRSKHLKLVDIKHEGQLLGIAAPAIAWGGSALGPRAQNEVGGEPFQELSLAIGLLVWLAWDTAIDVQAAVNRTRLLDPEKEETPWYAIQSFATVAAALSADEDARETLNTAVTTTPRKGGDAAIWLKTHLGIADHLARVVTTPEKLRKPLRPPRPGDLVVLGAALDPRVRIALEVARSGDSDKITVLDPYDEKGQRQFLATHVCYVALWEPESAFERVG